MRERAFRFAPTELPTCIMVTYYVYSLAVAGGEPESCEGLDNIGNSALLQCQRSDDCLFLDCNATSIAGFGAVLHLYPCDKPPAIELLFKKPDGLSPVGKFNSSDPITANIYLNITTKFEITVSWITNQIFSFSVCFN